MKPTPNNHFSGTPTWSNELGGGGINTYIWEETEEEPTQEELAEMMKPDIDRILMIKDGVQTFLYKQHQEEGEAPRVYFASISIYDNLILGLKIEYSPSDDEYISELYKYQLTMIED